MNYNEQVKKYLEYCEFRKELDWNYSGSVVKTKI